MKLALSIIKHPFVVGGVFYTFDHYLQYYVPVMTAIDVTLKVMGGAAIVIYTCIRIKKSLNNK